MNLEALGRLPTKGFVYITLALLLLAFSSLLLYQNRISAEGNFSECPLPAQVTQRLFDIGVVDANGDQFLDIYTSNHHFRQVLWISDGRGFYRDVVSEWGLDQDRNFPLAELAYRKPEFDKSGVYVYWYGTQIVIVHKQGKDVGRWHGRLVLYDPVKIVGNKGFQVAIKGNSSYCAENIVEFSPNGDGKMVLRPGGQGLPLHFSFSGGITADQLYVGQGKVSPPTTHFSLSMQDRHAMAWADINGDGRMDIYINRGALSGTLVACPEPIRKKIKDEFLVSRPEGTYEDVASIVGFEKKGCSGRHANWVDVNGDNRLDLFVNCYDRDHVEGEFPKQLYVQDKDGYFHDVAEEIGLGLPEKQIGSYVWIDAEDDGDADLVAFQDEGICLYRNRNGKYVAEWILKRPLGSAERIGASTSNRWFFDGKMTAADFDADGDLDIFSASRRGNVFLRNEKGNFAIVDVAGVGLPRTSMAANWVDYDNDGRMDLYVFPQGLFQQDASGSFHKTGILAFAENEKYMAALVNWFDMDNDGRRDVLLALHENPDYRPWWILSSKRIHPEQWKLLLYKNLSANNHWLQIDLSQDHGNRHGIGAVVTIFTPGGSQMQQVGTNEGSFFSQGHYRLYFGLGEHPKADRIEIRWPDGWKQVMHDVPVDTILVVDRDSDFSHGS
ncbi:CRTAC1 family protein [Desulfacinum infernum]|nr:CRTAC1 family protein [Desulfacinum infernum]